MRGVLRSTLQRLGMPEVAAKLLGGESAKHTMFVDGECSIRNSGVGGASKFQMIAERDTAKIRPAAELAKERGQRPPKSAKPWFKDRRGK
jgi:hypothetical protein